MNLRVQPGLAHSRQTLDAFLISSSAANTVTGYGLPSSTNSASSAWLELRSLDIPLGHKDAAFVRSHFDGMEVRINDAPRANEIMVAVAVTDSGRPLARVGGLTKDQIKGEDGLR
jgi:hypothetical protein